MRANRGASRSIARTSAASPGASFARAGLISSTVSVRRYSGRNAASAIDHRPPTANPVVGGSRPWMRSIAAYRSSLGACLATKPTNAGVYVSSTARQKSRALARRKASEGRRCASGNVSARNSRMTMDSPSWAASGEGASPGWSLGPPSTRYGT